MRAAVILLGAVLGFAYPGQDGKPGTPMAKADPADAPVRAAVAEFTKAYNAGDAKALAALFTEDAELREESDDSIVGRSAILEHFAGVFADEPGSTIAVEIDSIRSLSADVAIEEGRTTVTPKEGEAELGRYEAIHVRKDGKWLQARVRELPTPEPTAHERLKPLEWLLGDWVDEGTDSLVHSSCAWSTDGNFLLRSFQVTIGGKTDHSVTQRIGWDPALKQIKGWIFDSNGGHGEQTWSRDADGRWVIKSSGVLADGRRATATNILEKTGKDSASWVSTDRTVGGEALGDGELIRLVRRPPAPKRVAGN